VHHQLALAAQQEGVSLNTFVNTALAKALAT